VFADWVVWRKEGAEIKARHAKVSYGC
jgi:hypothetical protein